MPYIRAERRSRTTGTRVTLYDTAAPENVFDPEGGRWVTYCEVHEMLSNHNNLADALWFLSRPFYWCEECDVPAAGGPPRAGE